jgi:ABC-type transporter Mla MlaB component
MIWKSDTALHAANHLGGTAIALCCPGSNGELVMLRITKQPIDEANILVKLEGKLLEPWIEEMQRSLGGAASSIELDLSALTFADSAGIQALASLIRNGAKLTACSGYIAAILQKEKS